MFGAGLLAGIAGAGAELGGSFTNLFSICETTPSKNLSEKPRGKAIARVAGS